MAKMCISVDMVSAFTVNGTFILRKSSNFSQDHTVMGHNLNPNPGACGSEVHIFLLASLPSRRAGL
jgi:hypothetical protein